MDSPDIKQYVDLTIYDDDPITVLNSILATGRGLLPNWQPEAGQIETVLAEAIAVRSSQVAAAINRVSSATTEVLLQLFGLTRNNGTKATATVDIEFTGAGFLPAGTEFLYVDTPARVSYIFTLDSDLTFASAGVANDVAVSAKQVGSAYNFSAQNQYLTILTNIGSFLSCVFTSSPNGGTDAEIDSEYFNRAATLLASYTTALTTDSQIKFFTVSNKTYANRVEVYNRRRYRDRDTTSSTFGYHDGSVLVAVANKVSTASLASTQLPVDSASLADLYSSLVERTPSGLSVDVMSAELVKVHVNATITLKSGAVPSTVQAAIETALQEYLSPNVWDWALQKVRRNELIAIIDGVEGVDFVSALTVSGEPIIGVSNVGYNTLSGGSKATCTLNISGATPGTYTAGNAVYYYVDSTTTPDSPKVYAFVNTGTVTVAGGGTATGVAYRAIANGVEYNNSANGGVLPASPTFIGSAGDAGGTAVTSTSNGISGGSSDTLQFSALNGSLFVSDDLVLRNLGTLVTCGTVSLTFA